MLHAIHRVRAFEIVSPYTLCVRFDDTTEQTIDFEAILKGELYGPLRDLTLNSLSKSELIPTPRLWRGPTGRTSIQQLCTTGPSTSVSSGSLPVVGPRRKLK